VAVAALILYVTARDKRQAAAVSEPS